MLGRSELLDLLNEQMWPAFKKERDKLDNIDKWYRWDPDRPWTPRHATSEYKELAGRSVARWLARVVNAVVQQLYVEGYSNPQDPENATAWGYWQANGMDSRQIPLHRDATRYGISYATVLPGEDFMGEPMPVIRGVSPRRMISFYADEGEDDWPLYALRADPAKVNGSLGWAIRIYDDEVVHRLQRDDGDKVTSIDFEEHAGGVCPVVRYTNVIDLEGRVEGEVEPNIAIAGRINQTAFDRLIVQRFASWKVRTVTGMEEPTPVDGETEEQAKERTKRQLRVEDILAGEAGVDFGQLDETPLDGFIKAYDSDVRTLAAVSQTPVHELLGDMSNLSADAIAAARVSLDHKVEERKHGFGESHEQTLRLSSFVMGDIESARDTSSQVRWRDMQTRSLSQAADALAKLKDVGVPIEILLGKIPGMSQQDVDRATELIRSGDSLSQLANVLERQMNGSDE